MSLIGEECDSLGKTSLTSLVGNHGTTGGFRVKPSSVKGGHIIPSLFLLKENAILPMTAKAGCVRCVSYFGKLYARTLCVFGSLVGSHLVFCLHLVHCP